jgi:hypothetical protein
MILFLFGLLSGSLIVEQLHFTKCEKVGFKNQACKVEKKLCSLGKDKVRCEK